MAVVAPPQQLELQETTLHGHRVAYRHGGEGPVIVLLHGITSTSATWEKVLPYLATRFTVIAPDLIGHGISAKPRGDYSLGAYASGVRDLVVSLARQRHLRRALARRRGGDAAVLPVPERCERLVLVDSGGLGRRSAAVAGGDAAGSEWCCRCWRAGASSTPAGPGWPSQPPRTRGGHRHRGDGARRRLLYDREAARHSSTRLRTIVEPGGERVDASDRLYLAGTCRSCPSGARTTA